MGTQGLWARLTDSKVEGNSQNLEPNLCLDSEDPETRASRKRAGTPGRGTCKEASILDKIGEGVAQSGMLVATGLSMVAHSHNPSIWEKAPGELQVLRQPGLRGKFRASQGCTVRPCLKTVIIK